MERMAMNRLAGQCGPSRTHVARWLSLALMAFNGLTGAGMGEELDRGWTGAVGMRWTEPDIAHLAARHATWRLGSVVGLEFSMAVRHNPAAAVGGGRTIKILLSTWSASGSAARCRGCRGSRAAVPA